MSADKTKAVLSIGIKMFPFQISYVKKKKKKSILSKTREEFLPRRGPERRGRSPLRARRGKMAATRPP